MKQLVGAVLLVLVAGCAANPSPRTVPEPLTLEPTAAASGPLGVLELKPYVAGLFTVDVAVGDSVLPFIVDTGGGVTIVTPDVAEAIDCAPFGRGVGFRHDGERVEFTRCSSVTLRISGWERPAAELAIWDLMAIVPEGLPTLGGLVSLDSFEGGAVTLDLTGKRVVVESRASLASRLEDATEVVMRVAHQAAGASLDVFLAVEAESGFLWFELDSGNSGAVYLAPHAAEMLGLELSRSEPRPARLTLPGFGIVTVHALEKEMIYDGLLNADFLREHTVILDLAEERAWISR